MNIVPSRSFVIAGVIAWTGLIAAMLSVSREPVTVMAANVADEAPQLRKADRLPLISVTKKAMPIETVTPVETVILQASAVRPVATKKKKTERNVCTRHGMRKVYTVRRHWKSWRCRR